MPTRHSPDVHQFSFLEDEATLAKKSIYSVDGNMQYIFFQKPAGAERMYPMIPQNSHSLPMHPEDVPYPNDPAFKRAYVIYHPKEPLAIKKVREKMKQKKARIFEHNPRSLSISRLTEYYSQDDQIFNKNEPKNASALHQGTILHNLIDYMYVPSRKHIRFKDTASILKFFKRVNNTSAFHTFMKDYDFIDDLVWYESLTIEEQMNLIVLPTVGYFVHLKKWEKFQEVRDIKAPIFDAQESTQFFTLVIPFDNGTNYTVDCQVITDALRRGLKSGKRRSVIIDHKTEVPDFHTRQHDIYSMQVRLNAISQFGHDQFRYNYDVTPDTVLPALYDITQMKYHKMIDGTFEETAAFIYYLHHHMLIRHGGTTRDRFKREQIRPELLHSIRNTLKLYAGQTLNSIRETSKWEVTAPVVDPQTMNDIRYRFLVDHQHLIT